MKAELWIECKGDRDNVVAILVANGYTLTQIERAHKKYPTSMVEYGVLVTKEEKSEPIVDRHIGLMG